MLIRENYQKLLDKMANAVDRSGRNMADIRLVAVSKNQPLESILEAYNAGCRFFGESKVQEAEDKIPFLPQDCEWHLIGSLQKNKVGKALKLFQVIHSVDSVSLAERLSKLSDRPVPILLEVNVSGEESKHGMNPERWEESLEKVQLPNLIIVGLMTMAPFTQNENILRSCFKKLRTLLERWKTRMEHPEQFKELSMGMSNDYMIAIEEGATIVRIGTALFKKS